MESQNIEWKENWRDDFLKWISGFANAQGGKIYIGINDKGIVTGLIDAKNLLEEIPNKTRDLLGIMVDVNLKKKAGKNYIEIVVDAYPNPISYKGVYYYRSGSTKQELKGVALDKFILQKQGKRWDGVPVPKVTIKELDKSTFDQFRKRANETNRILPEILKGSNVVILDNLRLNAEDNYLKRAAVLLFHPDPEKYFTGAFIKIGFFNDDITIAYQDEVHGNLFSQVDQTLNLLLTKYMKAYISYDGIHRIEKYLIPETALREALLNAIAHKDYSNGNPTLIKVYENKLIVWNEAELPADWTVKNLKKEHSSRPFNPDIANAFFKAGLIEAWGQGTLRIIDECKKYKVSVPVFEYDAAGFKVEFNFSSAAINLKSTPLGSSLEEEILLLIKQNTTITIDELVVLAKKSKSTVQRAIEKLKVEKKIVREGSDKLGYWKLL